MKFPENYYELYTELLRNSNFTKVIEGLDINFPTSDFEKHRESFDKKDKHRKKNEKINIVDIENNSSNTLNDELHKKVKNTETTISYKRFMQIERNANNKALKDVITELKYMNTSKPINMPQVFLSYPIKDVLLAIMLFYFFESQGIYLYVDYMHNNVLSNGALKQILKQELEQSKQILLIDGRNNQISLDSKTYIRPWCAWEIGLYYEVRQQLNNAPYEKMFRLGWADPSGNGQQAQMINDFKIVNRIFSATLWQ